MSELISNFIKSIDVEEEIKKNQLENATIQETDQTTQAVENQELSNTETAIDVAASGATGVAHGITYVVDLPFLLVQGLESGKDWVFNKTAEAMGFNQDEATEIKTDVQIALDNADKFRPGEWLRENVFTYQPKSRKGEYIKTMGEWAAPGGILGKTTKAKNLFMATGAGSGAVKEVTSDVTGSEGWCTGVGIGVNLAADMYSLSKGNLAILSKNYLPSKAILEKAKKIEKDIKKIDKDFKLTGSEVTSGQLKGAEGQVTASIAGNKVMNKFWENRPEAMKRFIEKWGIQNGIIVGNKRFVSDVEYYKQLKKAALALSTQRSSSWKKAGGDKLEKFFYDSQKVDNLVVSFKNLSKNLEPSAAKTINQFAKNLHNTKGNGQAMHNVYREMRGLYYSLANNPNKTLVDQQNLKALKVMYKSLNTLMGTNTDYTKAQKAWIAFNDAYAEPITKGSMTQLFKSLSDAKTAQNPEIVGKMWKFLDSKAKPTDIALMAKSINKSGVPNLWEEIVTGYFNEAFLKSQAKHIDNGLSGGGILHDALMKHPTQKANFVEMMYQLAKTKDKSVKKINVEKSINAFADILKATGQGGKAGSTTAANLLFKEEVSKTKLEFAAGGFPIKTGIVYWWKDRTFSKNSEIIAKALTSDRGIQAFIDLTQDWKNYNKAFSLLRAVTVGAGEMN